MLNSFSDLLSEMTLDNPYPIKERKILNLKRQEKDQKVKTTFHARYLIEDVQSKEYNWIVEVESVALHGDINIIPNPNNFRGWHALIISFGTAKKSDGNAWMFNRADYDGQIKVGTPTRLFATIKKIIITDMEHIFFDDLKNVVGTIAFSAGANMSRGREAVYDRLAKRMSRYLHFELSTPTRGFWLVENPKSPHRGDPMSELKP